MSVVRDSLTFMTYMRMGLGIFDLDKPGRIQLLGSVGEVGYQGHGIGVYKKLRLCGGWRREPAYF